MLKKLKKPKLLALVFIILAVIGYLIYKQFITSRNGQGQLTTTKVEKQTLVSSVSASGNVISANIFNVETNATGIIKKVYVENSQKISKGQKIIEIELDQAGALKNSQNYAAYLSAKNSLDSANVSLYTLQSQSFAANQKFINDAVARDLAATDPTYIQEYADWKAAEAKYTNQSQVIAQAKVSLASSALTLAQSSAIVIAPQAGTIANITYTEGMTLQGTDSTRIAVIEIEGKPLISVNVSEIDVTRLKPAMKATITFDSIADKTFTGQVVSVDKIGSTTSGVTNYPVVIRLDTQNEAILSNMSTTANIILEIKENALSVPTSAVTTTDGQSAVRLLKNGREETVVVETGISSDSYIEIISGLSEGDEVVTGSQANSNATFGQGTQTFFSSGSRGGAVRGIVAPR
jgi:RND family efflux transporter MFP subunit